MHNVAAALSPRWVHWSVVGVVLAALTARAHDLDHAALSHFDEGVYAFSSRWVATGGPLYPMHEFYAPMGYPLTVGLGYLLGGESAQVAVGVSVLAGAATCLALFWVGLRLFGPGVGLAAAALLAVSDLHAAFSKTALTDPLFTLLFVTALGLLHKAWESGRMRDAAVAGLVVGLAWHTKYNGFLPLAIWLLAMLLDAVRRRPPKDDSFVQPAILRRAIPLVLACGTAFLAYLPWICIVNICSSYADLMRHHAGYAEGLAAWPANAMAQLGQWAVFRHWGALAAVVLLAFAAGAVLRAGRSSRAWTLLWAAAALCATLYAGVESVYLAAAVCGVAFAVSRGDRADRFVAAWVLLLLVMTPLYHPYVRLTLPLIPGLILLAVRWASQAWSELPAPRLATRIELGVGLLLILLAASAGGRLMDVPWGRWQSSFAARGGYAEAGSVLDRTTESDAIVITHAQPPMAFYCPRPAVPTTDQDLVAVADSIRARTGRPVYLAVDFIVGRHPTAARSLNDNAGRLELVARVSNPLGLPALLDEFGARGFWRYLQEFDAERFRAMRTIRICRLRPGAPSSQPAAASRDGR